MASRFEGYTKFFIKVPVDITRWEGKERSILKENLPTYGAHLTLATINVKNDCIERFKTSRFSDELRTFTIAHLGASLETTNLRYELLGTKPECFAFVFDLVDPSPIERWKCDLLDLLTRAFGANRKDVTLFEKYEYVDFIWEVSDETDVIVARVPKSSSNEESAFHVTLLSSFDLKRRNKASFKCYEKSPNKRVFLEEYFGPVPLENEFKLQLDALNVYY
jgi:hypothetical protein